MHRQLIKSEQSKVECCLLWTYRDVTTQSEKYILVVILFFVRGTSISGLPDCTQNMCAALNVQN